MILGQGIPFRQPVRAGNITRNELPNIHWVEDPNAIVIGLVSVYEFDGEQLVPDPFGPIPVVEGQSSQWSPVSWQEQLAGTPF